MNIWIDGDGCPIVHEAIDIANAYKIHISIVCDYAHQYRDDDAEVIMVDTGRDQVDYAILKRIKAGDIVITQDYGLAALVLARKGYAINQNGQEYHKDNIEALLDRRAIGQKYRKHHRFPHIAKRTQADDQAFCDQFEELLISIMNQEN